MTSVDSGVDDAARARGSKPRPATAADRSRKSRRVVDIWDVLHRYAPARDAQAFERLLELRACRGVKGYFYV
jgi:hypothetical protein